MPRFAIASSFLAATVLHAADGVQSSYQSAVQPVLEQYCYDCHSDGVRKGKFALDEHKDFASLRGDLKHWDHVRQMLATHVMPPVGKDAPALPQRDAVVKWIDDNIFSFDPKNPDPGHVVLRRLNRSQYNNTVRDLLFVSDQQPASEFPPDDTGYGFDNIGAVLSISPMLMEKYLRAATQVADSAFKVRTPEKISLEVGAVKFERKKDVTYDGEAAGVIWFFSQADSNAGFKVPSNGTYRLIVHASATQAGNEKPRIGVSIDGKPVGEVTVSSNWAAAATKFDKLEVEAPIKAGYHKLKLSFLNDFADPAAHTDRNVAVDKVDIEGPVGLTTPAPSSFLSWLAPNATFGLPTLELSGEDFLPGEGTSARDTGAMNLATNGYVRHPLELSEAGKYRFTLKLGALQAGKENAKWELRLGDQVLKAGEVTAKEQAPQWFTFETELKPGRHDLRVAFLNDFYDEKAKADRNLWVHEVKVEGPLADTHVLAAADLPALVKRVGDRLFRRPMREDEQTKWNTLAQQALKLGEPPLGALRYVVEGMIASPAFLFHSQPTPSGSRVGSSELIDEITLANRLSYFLWSAPADQELMDLASKGQLRANFDKQVRRMIASDRIRAFTENFGGQWLMLRDVTLISPSTRVFPDFDGAIASDMRRETEALFNHLLSSNGSVIDFLDADYTFVNKRLARFYNLPDADKLKTKDKYEFVKVSLAGTPRGGILTQGSILAVTSNPTRTNIVRRGKFVLENILGLPPPPAPGDVPALDEKQVRFGNQTLRQQFEMHRKDLSCAGCHALLDPIGFAMENYDAIGRFRERDHQQPVDATGKLIRGQQFRNLEDLRTIIVRDMKPDFVRCLSENLLTFSIGRGLEYQDRPAVRDIVQQAEKAGWKFQELILAVAQSVPFQRMRVGE